MLLEAERDRIPLWLPVAVGAGIAAWFLLPGLAAWAGWMVLCAAMVAFGFWAGYGTRAGRMLVIGAVASALGMALVWAKAERVSAPVLGRPAITEFDARIIAVQSIPARDQLRLVVAPKSRPDLPPKIRVTAPWSKHGKVGWQSGDGIRLKARLMPPPRASLPGGYDFAQRAWFDGIGAVGSVLGDPVRISAHTTGTPPLRAHLSAHIQLQIVGSAGGIAAALASGDQGGISEEDAEAMRRSGLAHLLSISGLHVTAVVGAVMLVLLRLLALSPRLALRWPLLTIAAGGGALAGLGYTLLTGSEVPTVRSFVAALLVLIALMMGRQALTLRLIAAGALVVMLLWPETVAGPSFQLSFAAVTAIVALNEWPRIQTLLQARDEPAWVKLLRGLLGLILVGLAVEVALFPIALFHFHKAGVYGALANMVAIPLTTFVIMPLEAVALLFDSVGLGAPFWWIVGKAIGLLLAMAHLVAAAPGAVAAFPVAPTWAFGAAVGGALWFLLWHQRWRFWGVPTVALGIMAMAFAPSPDLLISRDGRHVAARGGDGGYALLRARTGDYVRDSLNEAAGQEQEMAALTEQTGTLCSPDFCRWTMQRDARSWTILAARSDYAVDPLELSAACAGADIVIADRFLPESCQPRWFRADRSLLETSGGLAVHLSPPRVIVSEPQGYDHPWRNPELVSGNDEAIPPISPAP